MKSTMSVCVRVHFSGSTSKMITGEPTVAVLCCEKRRVGHGLPKEELKQKNKVTPMKSRTILCVFCVPNLMKKARQRR